MEKGKLNKDIPTDIWVWDVVDGEHILKWEYHEDDEMNYSKELWENQYSDEEISKRLHKKRKEGKTSGMWVYVGIPWMKRNGKWNELYQWEKDWFKNHIGVRWDEKGNQLHGKK